MDEAVEHCTKGLGIFEFASNCKINPDVVLVGCGDSPLEVLRAS